MKHLSINDFYLSLFVAFSLLILISGCHPRNLPGFRQLSEQQERQMRKVADEKIEKQPVFQELNKLCTQEIPIYEGFSLINIHLSWNEEKYLTYFYFSDADWRKVRVFYKDYFAKNSWQIIEDYDTNWGSNKIEVKKDSYRVILYNNGLGEDANYGFHCEKISKNQNNESNFK